MAESRTYELRDFDTVAATTGIRAIVTIGGAYSVRVEAREAAMLDRVDVSVAGRRLHIGIGRSFLDLVFSGGLLDILRHGGDLGITAHITLPVLNGAEASSGARIGASDVKSERFDGDASSGGQLTLLSVSGGIYRIQASSGGRIEIEGAVGEFDAAASSGGNVRGGRLTAERGRLEASSGGHLEAAITARVRANASSGGSIRIDGNPAERDLHSSSGGHITI